MVDGEFLSVSAGYDFNCAVNVDQDITCWGWNLNGQVPEHIDGPFDSVDVSDKHACAIKAGRSIACWGSNDEGQAPAAVAGSFMSVSATSISTCAVETGGDLRCWGTNANGQAPAMVKGALHHGQRQFMSAVAPCAKAEASVCFGAVLGGWLLTRGSAGSVLNRHSRCDPTSARSAQPTTGSVVGAQVRHMPTPPGKLPVPGLLVVPATEGAPYRHVFTVSTDLDRRPHCEGGAAVGSDPQQGGQRLTMGTCSR